MGVKPPGEQIMAASGAVKHSPGPRTQAKAWGCIPSTSRMSPNWHSSASAWNPPLYTRAMP